jgi:8-amino-7-oxononanoate synthase
MNHPSALLQHLERELAEWTDAGLRRELAYPTGLDFTSNDYLGLSNDKRVIQAARVALEKWGAGTPAARLLRGHNSLTQRAEATAAHWLGTEGALLFPTGWQANQAVLTSFLGPQDILFSDTLNHASLIDGARLCKARRSIFLHNDMKDLRGKLAQSQDARRRLIVIEDVYSMDGDRAPIAEILDLANEFDAYLYIDLAHSIGLYPASQDPHPRILARMFTGGKALGLCAAFVVGATVVIETLINKGRSFVFTTAPSPAVVGALTESMIIARDEPQRATIVFERAQQLREILKSEGIRVPGESPIVPVIIGDADHAMAVAERIRLDGFDVRAIRPPTVPKGQSRLRIVVHADHSEAEIQGLAQSVARAVKGDKATPIQSHRVTKKAPVCMGLVVCGTDTEVGKTVCSALILHCAQKIGLDPHYLKPMQTGDDSDTDTVQGLTSLSPDRFTDPVLQLDLPASVDQAAKAQGRPVEMQEVLAGTRTRMATSPQGFWILECAGGLRVPINDREDQADFVEALGMPLVLIARSSLGTLNHTLLSVEAIQRRRLPLKALFLVGPEHTANQETLAQWLPKLPILSVPRFDQLDIQSLDLWASQQDLDWLML